VAKRDDRPGLVEAAAGSGGDAVGGEGQRGGEEGSTADHAGGDPLAYWLRSTVDGSARCIKTARARVSPPALTRADWMPTTR
jgi:hypothetical protein